ncbi:hypothetical protein NFF69_13810 [Proteus mirabilis]|uniref:hypothetical protein n=1 Tax=Proteus mirabilis TaxID=584 RepID=UPI0023F64BD1|nr:hypothetical protein [Proteus mirabilis]MDF7245243.1 hypothetical protein [Proteus mirabilis]MDF7317808.1 hypothetical protein [Proteus mirabilis]
MDKSRQQFEEEFKDCNSLDVDDPFRIWDEINDYYYLETRQAWFWWQASRESLINNLEPVAWMYPSIGKSDCMVITKSAEESENIEVFFDSHGLPFKVTPLYRLDK